MFHSNTRRFALLLAAGTFFVLGGVALQRPFGWRHPARADDQKADEGKPAPLDADKIGTAAGQRRRPRPMASCRWRPRTDVKVTVDGMPLKPFAGLGSWAAFTPAKNTGRWSWAIPWSSRMKSPRRWTLPSPSGRDRAAQPLLPRRAEGVLHAHRRDGRAGEAGPRPSRAVWDAIKKVRAKGCPSPPPSSWGHTEGRESITAEKIEKISERRARLPGWRGQSDHRQGRDDARG